MKYYVYDLADGFMTFDNREDARKHAERALDIEREHASNDEWYEDIETLEWGELRTIQYVVEASREECINGEVDYIVDYKFEDK